MSGAATTALRDEIKSAFGEAGLSKIDPSILSKCTAMATTFRVSPKQMAECWEAFSLNKNLDALNEHSLDSYRAALKKETDSSGVMEMTGAVVSRPALGKRQAADENNLPSVTPPAKRFNVTFDGSTPSAVDSVASNRRVSLSPAPPGSLQDTRPVVAKYNERQGAGKVVVTYNPNKLQAVEAEAAADNSTTTAEPKCTVSTDLKSNVTKPYRHMFTTMEDRAKALDRHLVDLGEDMVERYGLGKVDEESETGIAGLEAVGVPRQDKVCCIGRICNAAHEGRINATSVLLEGSRHTAGGARIELDLSHLKAIKSPYSLFPGQIVAVEGMNTSGRKIVADRICEGAAHEPEQSTVKELLRFHHDDSCQGGKPLKIMSVCGPYTTSDNLKYEPLTDLVNIVRAEKPDVVIMAGPFVDMRHKAVRSGQTMLQFQDGEEILVSFETFFANKVAGLLEDLFSTEDESIATQFVLVPSLDDATAEWVYPQPPLADRLAGGSTLNIPGADGIEVGTLGLHHVETAGREGKGHRRVHCVSNPCTLKINELVVGVTATDSLFHVSADETNASLEPGSRLARISQHMLQQRSYYPLFPPSQNANLDMKHMDQWTMPCQPDLLIIPSKLTSFARSVLGSSVAINPGHLSRDTTGGTFAMVEVHPMMRETLENAGGEDVLVKHNVSDRTRVEIRRI